jgi:hypothetical protein
MPFSRKAAQARVSKVFNAIAPLGGLDDIDPIANMDPKFCIVLQNWFPGNASLTARQGYREWVTGLVKPVRTVMPYYGADGTYKLFAATDNGIYDATLSSNAPPIATPCTNGYYKHVIFGNVAFQFLVAVNGLQNKLFNGTTWINFVEEPTTPVSPGQIKGVNPQSWSHVAVFQRRLWFVQKDTMTAWYLPVDAVAGEAKPFYLGGVFRRGGKLVYMIDWSVDGGGGIDNKMVFVSNAGEVAVYSGTDPDNLETWSLDAVFYAAPPVGERGFVDFGGDVLMVTTNGLIPLTKVLMGLMSEAPYEQALTKRISRTLNQLILSRKYQLNWEVINMPTLQAIVVFVPPNGQEPPIQFVMNILTGAWTRFDLPANCACLALGDMYFGTVDGRVMKYGNEGYLDNVSRDGTGGVPITCNMFSAYTYMEDPTTLKHWKLIRPLFQSKQPPNYLIHLNVDYQTDALPGAPAPPVQGPDEPIWGTFANAAVWDDAFWSSVFTSFHPWLGVAAVGFCCAVLLKVTINEPTSMVAIKFVYEPGGVV